MSEFANYYQVGANNLYKPNVAIANHPTYGAIPSDGENKHFVVVGGNASAPAASPFPSTFWLQKGTSTTNGEDVEVRRLYELIHRGRT